MSPLLQILRESLEPFRSREIAKRQESYLLNQFPFLGIRIPHLRKVLHPLLKNHSSPDWRRDVLTLWEEPEREFHQAAIHCAIHHKKLATIEDFSLYEQLITSKSWWDSVDWIAPHLVGSLLLRFPSLISKVDEWVASENMWLRRASIIHSLRWKVKTDQERLFSICTRLGKDKEFFIRKAIGWALREYSKIDPNSVRNFLSKASLSPLSTREASKYI